MPFVQRLCPTGSGPEADKLLNLTPDPLDMQARFSGDSEQSLGTSRPSGAPPPTRWRRCDIVYEPAIVSKVRSNRARYFRSRSASLLLDLPRRDTANSSRPAELSELVRLHTETTAAS